jgi:hypothetical protein
MYPLKWREKHTHIVLLLLAFVALSPFLLLALYTQPSSRDEFLYAFQANKSAYDFFMYYYTNTTGRYTLIPIMQFANPMQIGFPYFIWGLRFFAIFYFFLLFGSFYFLCRQVGKDIIGSTYILYISLVFYVVFLNNLAGIEEYFYWFVGATAYLIPTVLYVLFVAFFVKCMQANKATRIDYIALYALLVLSMGGNELLNIFHLFLFGWIWLHCIWTKSSYTKFITLILVVSVVCSLFLFLAPGNFARLSTLDKIIYDHTHIRYAYKPLWKIIILSMYFALGNIGNWLSNAFLWLFVLSVVPYMVALDRKYGWSKSKMLHPVVFSFALFLVFSIFHVFILRANHYGISRVMAFLHILFLFGFLINMQMWVAYLLRYVDYQDFVALERKKYTWLPYLQIGMLALSILPANYNINNAYYEIFLVAPQFDTFNQKRFETLVKASKQKEKNVVLPKTPPALRSKYLIVEDFGNAQEPYNKAVARYFGLESIEAR